MAKTAAYYRAYRERNRKKLRTYNREWMRKYRERQKEAAIHTPPVDTTEPGVS